MAKQVAVAIGVKRAGTTLIELPGAVNGAKEFEAWATQQGYTTHLITDEGQVVTARGLKELVTSIVKGGETERLLIYFAGHGIQPTANTAFWLLSNWEDDSDEAINVNLSFSNAKRSGIQQISVFSDACRSTVRDAGSVGGSTIFPKTVSSVGAQPQWDHFYASQFGESAQEVAAADAAKAYGVFTRCVMNALSGKAEKAIENRPPRVVTSQQLAAFLEEIVPLESGRIPGATVQFPEVSHGWSRPKDVYLAVPNAAPVQRTVPPILIPILTSTPSYTITQDFHLRAEPRADAATNFFATPFMPVKKLADVDNDWLEVEVEGLDAHKQVGFARRTWLSEEPGAPLDQEHFAEVCFDAALHYGANPHFMLALAATEAEVISGTGTQDSVGPFAFTEVEWKASNDPSETELYDRDRFDPFRQPIVAARRVAKLATQARALFPSERMPTSEELYLAWMFGIPALKALRQDPPDRLVSETLTKAMAPFEVDGIFEKRPTLLRKGMTIRELRSDVTNRLSRNLPATAELMVSVATDRLDADASANEALLASAIGRRGFETAQGLSIVGARAVAAVVHGEDVADLFEENGTHHVRGHRRGQPQTTLIKLENGNWIAACILPDFVGTIVVKDGVAVSVRYRPDLHGRFHSEAFKHVAGLVNRWTALMQQGRFGNYGELETAAESLRQYKHSDPSLGVLAAYAYERAGNLAQIDDIAWWFAQEDQPIPFDVALLSTSDMTLLNGVHHIEAKGLSGNTSRGTVAGSFPYLTQGWSFLDPDDKAIHPALFDLRKGLLPALCTTLRVEEGDKVANLVHRGEL